MQVPSNAGRSLGYAIPRLLDAGLRISIPSFPPQAPGVGLDGYFVRVQEPRAPALVERGSVVTLKLHSSPLPLAAFRAVHPPTVVVPELVGLRYRRAIRRVPEGLWIHLRRVPPLPPERSVHGLDAFVVASQRPRAGARVPYGCTAVPGERGCSVSIVELSLDLAR